MEASPLSYLSEAKATPSTLIIHGGRDMLVPFSQSCQLYNYMKELGKEVEFYKLNDANHGFLGFNNDTVLHIVLEFLKNIFKEEGIPTRTSRLFSLHGKPWCATLFREINTKVEQYV